MSVRARARVVRVEHVVNLFGKGAAVSLPIVVSDSAPLLRMLLGELGTDNDSPLEWDLGGRHRPFASWEYARFNRAAGWRLRQHLHALVGARWRWRQAVRTREFGTVSGSAGRVDIPIQRLWMAHFPTLPGPAIREFLRPWSDQKEFALWNDGLVAIDISQVLGIAVGHDDPAAADIVARLLAVPDVWDRIRNREGRFYIRVRADLAGLLDDRRALQVQWRLRRDRVHVADVAVMPTTGLHDAAMCTTPWCHEKEPGR